MYADDHIRSQIEAHEYGYRARIERGKRLIWLSRTYEREEEAKEDARRFIGHTEIHKAPAPAATERS